MTTVLQQYGEVKERERGKYEISYQPVTKGRNLLHIRVGGLNIRKSPFDVRVVSPVEDLGVPIQTLGGSEYPHSVTFNHAGEMVISVGHSISVLSPSGTKAQIIW